MSGFYITLPSNSSMNHFPSNTKSSFRTQLAQSIKLNEPHEVALVEINYSSNIQTYYDIIMIICDFYKNIFSGYNSKLKIPINIKILKYIEVFVNTKKVPNLY